MILYIVCKDYTSIPEVLSSMLKGELLWYESPEVAREDAKKLTKQTKVRHKAYAVELKGEFVEVIS